MSAYKVGYFRVLAMLEWADYLLIANPVAFNQLGIRYYCAMLLANVAGG